MSALRELLARFDIDTGAAVTKMRDMNRVIGGAKAAFVGLTQAFAAGLSAKVAKDFIEGQIELGSQLNDTAERLGVSTEELQKFQFAAGLSGVSAEAAAKGLGFLNKNLGDAVGGNAEAAKTFSELGIDLASVKSGAVSAADLLPALAEKFANAGSDAERTATAMRLFGRSGASLIPLLKQGSGELAKLSEEFYALGGGLDEGFISTADRAGDEIDKLKFAFSGLKSRFAVDILPHVTEFAIRLQKGVVWLRNLAKETYLVQEVLGALGIVGAVAAAKTAVGWAKVFGLFPKGNVGLLKTLASLGTLGAGIIGLGGLGLVLEDLWVGMNGGQSTIRGMLEKANGVEETDALFQQWKATVDQIGEAFEGIKPALKSVFEQLGKIAVSPEFIQSLNYAVRLAGSLFTLLVGAARAAGNMALFGANVLGGKLSDADKNLRDAGKAIDQAGGAVFGQKGFFGDDAFKPPQIVQPRAAIPDPTSDPSSPYYYPRSAAPAPSAPVTNNTTKSVTLNIHGTGDEQVRQIRRVVDEALGESNADAGAALRRGR